MNLRILSHSADITYNGMTIPLLSFINRLSCETISNTESPAIYIDMSDYAFSSPDSKERMAFFKTILDQLKHNSYLRTYEYNSSISKIAKIVSNYTNAYNAYYVRVHTPSGKILSYELSELDIDPPMIKIKYENGHSRLVDIGEFLYMKLPPTPSIQREIDNIEDLDKFCRENAIEF
jgi:hypothetical protein